MEELLIEDKKYVSSKRAAKMTGYAKDYVGQLCREGRVPARLVGRSWYVLEAAIQDHRFGGVDSQPATASKTVAKEATRDVLPPTWEKPRYEAPIERTLPVATYVQPKVIKEKGQERLEDTTQNLQDAWQEWFSNFDKTSVTAEEIPKIIPEDRVTITVSREEPVQVEVVEPKAIQEDREEVPVPLHTVYEPPPEELLPRRQMNVRETPAEEDQNAAKSADQEDYTEPRYSSQRLLRTIVGVGVMLSVITVILAVLGTGAFDNFIISTSQVRILAGVSVYNK